MFPRAAKRLILNRLSRMPYALLSNKKVQALTSLYLLDRATLYYEKEPFNHFSNSFVSQSNVFGELKYFKNEEAYEHVDPSGSISWLRSRSLLRSIAQSIHKKSELTEKDNYIFQAILKHAHEISPHSFQGFLQDLGVKNCDVLVLAATKEVEALANHPELFNILLSSVNAPIVDQLIDKIHIDRLVLDEPESFSLIIDKLSATKLTQIALYLLLEKTKTLQLVDTNILLKVMNIIYDHPDEIVTEHLNVPGINVIEIQNGGSSFDYWPEITDRGLSAITNTILERTPKSIPATPEIKSLIEKETIKPVSFSNLDQLGPEWESVRVRIQGRTILLINEKNILAFKVPKKGEPLRELEKEYKSTQHLREHSKELKLKSELPEAVTLTFIDGIFSWLKPQIPASDFKAFADMVQEGDRHCVYVYKVPSSGRYFTYLHDPEISDEDFKEANQKAIHDLYTLMIDRGLVFPQLTDMYHSNAEYRMDKGLHRPLFNASGTGQIRRWKPEFENLRFSGIADVGDHQYINEVNQGESFHHSILIEIAKILNVLYLVNGARSSALTEKAKKSGATDEHIAKIWMQSATQILDNCVHATTMLTDLPTEKIKKTFLSLIDIERLARQMQFWMTDEYIPYVKKNRIKENIYPSSTEINVECPPEFHSTLGFTTDDIHADLGAKNGQEPIKEMYLLLIHVIDEILLQANSTKKHSEALRAIGFWKDPASDQSVYQRRNNRLSK